MLGEPETVSLELLASWESRWFDTLGKNTPNSLWQAQRQLSFRSQSFLPFDQVVSQFLSLCSPHLWHFSLIIWTSPGTAWGPVSLYRYQPCLPPGTTWLGKLTPNKKLLTVCMWGGLRWLVTFYWFVCDKLPITCMEILQYRIPKCLMLWNRKLPLFVFYHNEPPCEELRKQGSLVSVLQWG